MAEQQKTPPTKTPATNGAGSGKQPNIIYIIGDDIGWFNIGVYNQGMMTGRTPNLDRLAGEGSHMSTFMFSRFASCVSPTLPLTSRYQFSFQMNV